MVATISQGGTTDTEVTAEVAKAWLDQWGLLRGGEDQATLLRRHTALSKCQFGEAVLNRSKRRFLQRLIPCERNLAAYQTDIGNVSDEKYHYKLRLNNAIPIKARPMRLHPAEEAWLDVHLDELLAKGVIGPILPHEQPRCVTPLLLVPGQQSG